jgi:pimeloyl-ACP methyl ester carboxylesterase
MRANRPVTLFALAKSISLLTGKQPRPEPSFMSREPRFHRFESLGPRGFHQIAYTEWGNPSNPHIVVCVHGLTRNSRDFDSLALALADRCRVVCMDVVGRGSSGWLQIKSDYGFALYLSDAAALIARVTASRTPTSALRRLFQGSSERTHCRVDWVGTSMGGLIGMFLAAKPSSPISRLVLNDVGPMVPWMALARLCAIHAAAPAQFANLEEVERHLRSVCAEFGPLPDAEWRHAAEHGAIRRKDGSYVLNYDPAILSGLASGATDGIAFGLDFLRGVNLWPMWDAVRCPALVLRGGESDVLLPATAAEMAGRGPKAQVVEFPGVGHAPWLRDGHQIGAVRDFLLSPAGVKRLAA